MLSEKMMLLVILLALLVATSAADPVENFLNARIAEGVPSKKGENLDFCWMYINFYEKQKICGGVIISETDVLTSALCVNE